MFSCILSIQWCNDTLRTYRSISKAVSKSVHCTHTWLTCDTCHLSHWLVSEPCLWSLLVVESGYYYKAHNRLLNHFCISAINNKGNSYPKNWQMQSHGHGQSIFEIVKCGFNIPHCECLSVLQCKIHITLCVYSATVYVCVHFLSVERFITEQVISMATT